MALLIAPVGLLASSTAQAQGAPAKTMLVEPPAPLLPLTIGELSRVAEGDVGDGLEHIDPAQAPALKEDGLRRFAQSDYVVAARAGMPSLPAHPVTNVSVYQFIDVSGAIGAYDFLLRPAMRSEQIGDLAASNSDETLFRSGKNVVVEHWKSARDTSAAFNRELINHLPKALGNTGLPPLLPTLLPAKGLDSQSIKYALGPLSYQAVGGVVPPDSVGFQKAAEAVTAKYRGGGTLTLVIYPTPEIAGEYFRAIQASLAPTSGQHPLRREGTLVALATGNWPAGEAEKMVNQVHMHTVISFDQPMPIEFHAEVQKTYTLLQSIALFCVLGALAAIVLGLFFGGGRALIRVMQGKPAATEPEFLRIDLRGVGAHPWKEP